MFSLKSLWKSWAVANPAPPERDEHLMVTESLMLELEYHCRELEKSHRDHDIEKRREQTGVDYSWLVSVPTKSYEIPQLERLELEDLCYKVKPTESGKILTAFRDAVLNEPTISELPKKMKLCIQQVLDQRPKDESLSEWITKRTLSLTNIKLRPNSKVEPFASDYDEVESQSSTLDSPIPDFRSNTLPKCQAGNNDQSFSLPF